MDKYTALKRYFGYSEFRDGQEKIIDNIMSGKDVLAIMPTGAGKSVCFQIPALLKEGTAIVISPLISLMKDQVYALKENGICAEAINTGLDVRQIERVYTCVKSGECKLLYVSPERLKNKEFRLLISKLDISFVCIDEAHCVSQWGQDFRSSYLEISGFLASFEKRPVVAAFTATATDIVRNDICRLLTLREPEITVTGFDRKNLFFEVQKPENKFIALRKCLDTHGSRSSIVYCSARKTVDELYSRLTSLGYSVSRYHAGLSSEERKNNQELFIRDKVKIMIATNAFGMGIDKSDVSLVVHYNMPGDIESYYQEAGRAGRDGLEADCILLYSHADVDIHNFFINNPSENEHMTDAQTEIYKRRKRRMLKTMELYCTGNVCLRSVILRYFGESAAERCDNCSVCCSVKKYRDITVSAQKVLSAVTRAKSAFTQKEITDILHGDGSDKETYTAIKTFGAMKLDSREYIETVINKLIFDGFIEITVNEKGKIPRITNKARQVLFEGVTVYLSVTDEEEHESLHEKPENPLPKPDLVLFTLLKVLRKDIASNLSIPPLAVFTDKTLREMSIKKPVNIKEMRLISGMSENKIKKYAPIFIKKINEYVNRK